ncbi:hypothetical protein DY000_02001439 [Brassica cretica]|uniref:DUF4005 domain-containing protein n=1 Tax=Brassica cretica TaxID=69181 RepID=A0ABQ7C2C0_BRACR|nr:hypothetical protein DY000_02001439 [Brassica cretica]
MEALDYKLNNKSRITDLSSKEKVEGKMSVYFGGVQASSRSASDCRQRSHPQRSEESVCSYIPYGGKGRSRPEINSLREKVP